MIAIKTVHETVGDGATELIREAAVMAQVTPHDNLVGLVGMVTRGAPLLMLLPLCEFVALSPPPLSLHAEVVVVFIVR